MDICPDKDDIFTQSNDASLWSNAHVISLWDGVECKRLTFTDIVLCCALGVWTFVLYSYGLGVLEFFRHTEADRTLISWEMVKGCDYLIPRILGDVILTKPPLYYWWTALFLSFFDEPTEYAARLSSVVAASLFVIAHYVFIFKAGGTRHFALICSLMLATGVGFFMLASVAEIDMTFALVCSLAFYFVYFAILKGSLLCTFLAHIFAASGFLTKGPAAIFMFYGGTLFFAIYTLLGFPRECRSRMCWKFIFLGIAGSLLMLSVVLAWLIPVSSRVGWLYIYEQFDAEFVQRIVSGRHHNRGVFYYLSSMLLDLMPWTPICFLGLLWPLISRSQFSYRSLFSNSAYRNLFVFCCSAIASGLLMLSVSDIKTWRYFFPYYGLLVTLTGLALINCTIIFQNGKMARRMYLSLMVIGVVLCLSCFGASIFLYMSFGSTVVGVDWAAVSVVVLVMCFSSLFFAYAAYLRNAEQVIMAILLIVVSARVAMVRIYAPCRNAVRSVLPIVQEINQLVPEGSAIYSVRLFERWVSYYLLRSGRRVYQDGSAQFKNLSFTEGKAYFLLSQEDDDKLSKLFSGLLNSGEEDASGSRLLATYALNGNKILLIEADQEKFKGLGGSQ